MTIEPIPATCVCSTCGEEKELTADNFHRDAGRRTGFEGRCRECVNERRRAEHARRKLVDPEYVARRKEADARMRAKNRAINEARREQKNDE